MFCFKIVFVTLLFVIVISTDTNVNRNKKGYTMPEACRGQTYCTEWDDHYPSEEDFERILDDWLNDTISNSIEDRVDLPCRGNYTNAKIYYIVDKNNLTLPVVQVENLLTQVYELRYCNKGGYKNCVDRALATLHQPYVCETQHMHFEFLVMNNDGYLQLTQALIPVCCKCHLI